MCDDVDAIDCKNPANCDIINANASNLNDTYYFYYGMDF